jgi:hypothetical protein
MPARVALNEIEAMLREQNDDETVDAWLAEPVRSQGRNVQTDEELRARIIALGGEIG